MFCENFFYVSEIAVMNLFYWMLTFLTLAFTLHEKLQTTCVQLVLQYKTPIKYILLSAGWSMLNVKCENNIPLFWGIHRSVLWLSSEIYQPCYLIIFCIWFLYWVGCVNEQKIDRYLKYAVAYGKNISLGLFIIVNFLLAWVFVATNIYMRLWYSASIQYH